MSMERWAKIDESPYYSVSDTGKVRNDRTGKILGIRCSGGYPSVYLFCPTIGRQRSHRTHRLVAKYFVENLNDKPEVNHKDGNKKNNHYSNLEWVTPSENQLHAYRIGLQIHVHGSGHFAAKIREKDVVSIRKMYGTGKYFQHEIASRFGINQQNVSLICSGKAWAHVTA